MSLLTAIGLKSKATINDTTAIQAGLRLAPKLEQAAYPQAELLVSQASDANRERLIYGFATHPQSVPLAATWAKARPQSATAHTLLGASMIVSGWTVRGGGYAGDVDASAWQPFLDSLRSAEEPLHLASRLDPAAAEPFSWLILAGVGRGAAPAELQGWFAQATARQPLHWPAYRKYFMACTEKWGGSHDQMFEFARTSAGRAPRGHLLHSLLAVAYCEQALALGPAALGQLRSKGNAREIASALYVWLDAKATNLPDKLQAVGGGFAGYALNHFALACYLCGAKAEAREVLAALNGEIETLPWAWIASGLRERINPAFVHDRVWRELGAAQA
jgi:hypothetical protein